VVKTSGMSRRDVMKNEELNGVVMQLEMAIYTIDVAANGDGEKGEGNFGFTDSVVKSALRRAMGHVKGRPPKAIKGQKERDFWLRNLGENLWASCQKEMEGCSRGDVLKSLGAIEDSLKIHTVGDSRGYLDYLTDFFGEMGVETRELSAEEAAELK